MKGKKRKEEISYLADFIWPVVDKKYRTRSDAADDLGIDQAVLSRICSGKWFGISEHLVENICARLGIDPAEGLLRLFLSKNPKIKQHFLSFTKATSFEIIPPEKHKAGDAGKSPSKDYISVPLISSISLADKFGASGKGGKINYILVPKESLPKNGNFFSLKFKGDYMLPTLPDGSIVVIDSNDTRSRNNCLFLYKYKNQIKIGRTFIQNSYLQISPDNPNNDRLDTCIIDMKKIKSEKNYQILGKLVLAFKKF